MVKKHSDGLEKTWKRQYFSKEFFYFYRGSKPNITQIRPHQQKEESM